LTNIENAKKKLGQAIREIAEGYGALKSDSLMTNQEKHCADDFEETAGEWVYELIKKVVLDGSEGWQNERIRTHGRESVSFSIPKFLVLDDEESWAGYIISDKFMGS